MSELLRSGGVVLWTIAAVSTVAWILILWHAIGLRRLRREAMAAPIDSADARSTATAAPSGSELRRVGLGTIARLGTILPLLGLLGTVLGMMETFDGLAPGRPRMNEGLASGISQALLTTQAGLVAALPILLAHRVLVSRTNRLVEQERRLLRRAERA